MTEDPLVGPSPFSSLARHGRVRHLGHACTAMLVALLLTALRAPVPLSPLVALFLGSAATAAAGWA